MSSRRLNAARVALLLVASLLSCGREVTGPNGIKGPYGAVSFAPVFASSVENAPSAEVHNVATLVPFTRVRVRFYRGSALIVDEIENFPAAADTLALRIVVPLESRDPAGEQLQVTLKFISAAGDTVFSGGPLTVTVFPGSTANVTPIELPVAYVGPGSSAVAVYLSPDSVMALQGATVNLTASALDGQEATVPNAVIGYESRDVTKLTVPNLAVPSANVVGARGTTWIVATLIGGAKDSTKVVIDPRPTSLVKVSGDNQQTLQDTQFPAPLVVRVTASDGLGVANWPVNFAVTSGQGSIDTTLVMTDSAGFAQVTWVAGDSVGIGTVTASIAAPALNAVFSGTQLSSNPSTLTFQTQPTNITAGSALPNIQVAVRNGLGNIITTYAGPVALSLSGGTAGANIVGVDTVNAVAGLATFTALTVDRGGTNYRLVATAGGATPVQSNQFNAAAAPADTIVVVSGGGQSASPNNPLADSIKVRVLDQFGFPVIGVNVAFAVTQGGGAVSPTNSVTDGDGRAATAWTLGSAGPQQITATVIGVAPRAIGATVIGGGGPAVLFAGYDFTYIPSGQSRNIPVFLSSPAGSPTVVQLATGDPNLSWDLDSIVIAPGVTRVDVPLHAALPGEYWATLTSPLGNDSVFVLVDSASVTLLMPENNVVFIGDTIRTVVRLSEPAPTDSFPVVVRSLNPTLILVAPGSGNGITPPVCTNGYSCYGGDLRTAPEPDALLLSPPADSAVVYIRQGQLSAAVVLVVVADSVPFPTQAEFEIEASGHVGEQPWFYVNNRSVSITGLDGFIALPIGAGQQALSAFYVGSAAQSRELRISIVSRNPAIVTVDSFATVPRLEQQSSAFGTRAVSEGSTYVVWSIDAFTDSTAVMVTAPKLSLYSFQSSAPGFSSGTVRVTVGDSLDYQTLPPTAPVTFTLQSTDTSIVKLLHAGGTLPAGQKEVEVPFQFVGVGPATIIVQAAGHLPDTMFVSSFNGSITSYANFSEYGVGQVSSFQVFLPPAVLESGPRTVHISTPNVGRMRILTPYVTLTAHEPAGEVRVEGLATGSVQFDYTSPGFLPLQSFNLIQQPRLAVNSEVSVVNDTTLLHDVAAYLIAGSTVLPPADTVVAVLRSANPAVVEVVDSLVVFVPGETDPIAPARFRAVGLGSTSMTLHAPGFDSSSAQSVTVNPMQLFFSTSPVIGVGGREEVRIYRNSPLSEAVPLTITAQGLNHFHVASSVDTIPAGVEYVDITLVGDSVGFESLQVTSPGLDGDTTTVSVLALQVVMYPDVSFPMVGELDASIAMELFVSGDGYTATDIARRFILRSTDTTRARVVSDTIRFSPGSGVPDAPGAVKYVGVGPVEIWLVDVDGAIDSVGFSTYVNPGQLSGQTSFEDDQMFMGMNQKTWTGEVFVTRGYEGSDSLWVYPKSSAPDLVSVPDSVLFEPGALFLFFDVTAHDSIGSAQIEVGAPGWNPWVFNVFVSRSVALPLSGPIFVGGRSKTLVLLADASTLEARPAASAFPLRFATDHPQLLDTAGTSFMYPAGDALVVVDGPTGLAVGQATVHLEDARSGIFGLVARGSSLIEVLQPTVIAGSRVYRVGTGLAEAEGHAEFSISDAVDSVWVGIRSLHGKFAPSADSILVERGTFIPEMNEGSLLAPIGFGFRGITAGIDTLVLEADGFVPDTVLVSVEPGVIRAVTVPTQTLALGDSAWFEFALAHPNGLLAEADVSQTISIVTDTTLAASDGSSTIGGLTVTPGNATFGFWLKGTNNGTSQLSVLGPNFVELRLIITVRPPSGGGPQ